MTSKPRSGRRTAAVPYAFLAPAVILFTLFLLLPIGYTVWLSLRRVQISGLGLGRGARKEIFAGFHNYAQVFADAELWAGVVRVVWYGLILVPTMLGLALLFALILDAPRTRLKRVGRLAIFLPYAVPSVIASLLWGFLYLPSVSPLHDALAAFGLPQPDLLGPDLITPSVANIGIWGGVGFNMVVLYTALRAVPAEIYESARLDGCTELGLALRVKIPMITPALIMTVVFSLIATVQVFAEPATLAPLTNSLSSTWTPMMKVYRDAFIRNDIYSAAATSLVFAALTLILSLVFLRFVGRRAFGAER